MIQFVYSAFRSVRPLKFPLLYATGLAFLVAMLSLSASNDYRLGVDLASGCILSVTNAFLGYLVFRWSFSLQFQVSLLVSFAGMLVRFSLMLIGVVAMILMEAVTIGPFLASFMTSYVAFMALEVSILHRGQLEPELAPARNRK